MAHKNKQNKTITVASALPVIWTENLTTNLINSVNNLTWSVAQQINNQKFIIEHSNDGKNFLFIGEIKVEGNVSQETDYEYIHKLPTIGTNYYRIKQVDYDGKFEYSNVASVNYQSDIKHLTIHPNPVNNQVYVSTQTKIKLSIFNQFGMIIKQIELKKGKNEVDMSDLRNGIYIFRTENGEVERVMKL